MIQGSLDRIRKLFRNAKKKEALLPQADLFSEWEARVSLHLAKPSEAERLSCYTYIISVKDQEDRTLVPEYWRKLARCQEHVFKKHKWEETRPYEYAAFVYEFIECWPTSMFKCLNFKKQDPAIQKILDLLAEIYFKTTTRKMNGKELLKNLVDPIELEILVDCILLTLTDKDLNWIEFTRTRLEAIISISQRLSSSDPLIWPFRGFLTLFKLFSYHLCCLRTLQDLYKFTTLEPTK